MQNKIKSKIKDKELVDTRRIELVNAAEQFLIPWFLTLLYQLY